MDLEMVADIARRYTCESFRGKECGIDDFQSDVPWAFLRGIPLIDR